MRKMKHGNSRKGFRSPEYGTWIHMVGRCTNSSNDSYEQYGARGIVISQEWRESFEQFLADMGERPSLKYSIERRDVNGNYCKENCYWADATIQARNRRRQKNNSTGITGVSWVESRRKYRVTIKVSGKQISVGYYSNIVEAATHRKKAEIKYWEDAS